MGVSVDGYGPVAVRRNGSLRIGYYDDDEGTKGIVYYAAPPLVFDTEFELVPLRYLFPIDTVSLNERQHAIGMELAEFARASYAKPKHRREFERRFRLMLELEYINTMLIDRLAAAVLNRPHTEGKSVFISHASADKSIALSLSLDLADEGYRPWLDHWEIEAGESIPGKLAEGLRASDYLLLLLSEKSVSSGWVEAEWTTQYWDEAKSGSVKVIPVLLSDCQIPTLLKSKKYVDLRNDYQRGLELILRALKK